MFKVISIIEKVEDELRKLLDDMIETIILAPIGYGVQIGILKRIIVIDISKKDEKKPIFDSKPFICEDDEYVFV